MLRVETKERRNNELGQNEQYLIINEVEDEKAYYTSKRRREATFFKKEVIDILLQHTFKEVGKHFREWSFYKKIPEWPDVSRFAINYIKLLVYQVKSPFWFKYQ